VNYIRASFERVRHVPAAASVTSMLQLTAAAAAVSGDQSRRVHWRIQQSKLLLLFNPFQFPPLLFPFFSFPPCQLRISDRRLIK